MMRTIEDKLIALLKKERDDAIKRLQEIISELDTYQDAYELEVGPPQFRARWIYLKCAYIAHPVVERWSNGAANVGDSWTERKNYNVGKQNNARMNAELILWCEKHLEKAKASMDLDTRLEYTRKKQSREISQETV